MSTPIRPEVSEKNRYWISRHRYYELKHFCLQYNDWKRAAQSLSMYPETHIEYPAGANCSNPVPTKVELLDRYKARIEMVESAAKEADPELSSYILDGVTQGHPYNYLHMRTDIPCCKETYYDRYRRFFWLLSQARQ